MGALDLVTWFCSECLTDSAVFALPLRVILLASSPCGTSVLPSLLKLPSLLPYYASSHHSLLKSLPLYILHVAPTFSLSLSVLKSPLPSTYYASPLPLSLLKSPIPCARARARASPLPSLPLLKSPISTARTRRPSPL